MRAMATGTHRLGTLVMLFGIAWLACFALPGRLRQRLRDALSRHAPSIRA